MKRKLYCKSNILKAYATADLISYLFNNFLKQVHQISI